MSEWVWTHWTVCLYGIILSLLTEQVNMNFSYFSQYVFFGTNGGRVKDANGVFWLRNTAFSKKKKLAQMVGG